MQCLVGIREIGGKVKLYNVKCTKNIFFGLIEITGKSLYIIMFCLNNSFKLFKQL